MDRWSGRDRRGDEDDSAAARPMGQVARTGLSAFVKADQGMGSTATAEFQRATVTVSRRQQAQNQMAAATAARLAAGGAAQPSAKAPAAPRGFNTPCWAADPPPGAELKCFKNGALVQTMSLRQKATLFGRLATADVQLEHASISRQHAVLCFRDDGQAVLVDLDSAHGTFVGSERLLKHTPREVGEGEDLRFGASTRSYLLQRRPVDSCGGGASCSGNAATSQKRGVSWPDEDGARPEGKRRSSGNGLERVIGYSDGAPFAVNVGPAAAASDEAKGRFANLVSHVVRPHSSKPEPEGATTAAAQQLSSLPAKGDVSVAEKVKRLAQDEFRRFVESGRRRSSSFYDDLPPPTAGS